MNYQTFKHNFFIFYLLVPCNMPAMKELTSNVTIHSEENRIKNYTQKKVYCWQGSLKMPVPLLTCCEKNILFTCYTKKYLNGWLFSYEEHNMLTEIDLNYNIETRFEPIDELNKENIIVSLVAKEQDNYIIGHGSQLAIYKKQNNIFTSPKLILEKKLLFNVHKNDTLAEFFAANGNWFVISSKGAIFKIDTNRQQTINGPAISSIYTPAETVYAVDYDGITEKIAFGFLGKIQIIDLKFLNTITKEITELQDSPIKVISLLGTKVACATRLNHNPSQNQNLSGPCDECYNKKRLINGDIETIESFLLQAKKQCDHNKEKQKNIQSVYLFKTDENLVQQCITTDSIDNVFIENNELYFFTFSKKEYSSDKKITIKKIEPEQQSSTIYKKELYRYQYQNKDYLLLKTPPEIQLIMTHPKYSHSCDTDISDVIVIKKNEQHNKSNNVTQINPLWYHAYRAGFKLYHKPFMAFLDIIRYSVDYFLPIALCALSTYFIKYIADGLHYNGNIIGPLTFILFFLHINKNYI